MENVDESNSHSRTYSAHTWSCKYDHRFCPGPARLPKSGDDRRVRRYPVSPVAFFDRGCFSLVAIYLSLKKLWDPSYLAYHAASLDFICQIGVSGEPRELDHVADARCFRVCLFGSQADGEALCRRVLSGNPRIDRR